ncbi:MAG: hypothetical protein ACP5O4_08040, partial [bacterium]
MKKNIVLILLAAILSMVSIVIGKISNNFGTNLGRDLDNDGDNDAGVVINNIAGGNGDDTGSSLYVDNVGKIYVT